MADLDDEFAKFSAEISAVEQEQEQQKLPPPMAPPPSAASAQPAAAAGNNSMDDEFAKFTAEISAAEMEGDKAKPKRPVTATVSAKPMKASKATVVKAPAPHVPPPQVPVQPGSLLEKFYEKVRQQGQWRSITGTAPWSLISSLLCPLFTSIVLVGARGGIHSHRCVCVCVCPPLLSWRTRGGVMVIEDTRRGRGGPVAASWDECRCGIPNRCRCSPPPPAEPRARADQQAAASHDASSPEHAPTAALPRRLEPLRAPRGRPLRPLRGPGDAPAGLGVRLDGP